MWKTHIPIPSHISTFFDISVAYVPGVRAGSYLNFGRFFWYYILHTILCYYDSTTKTLFKISVVESVLDQKVFGESVNAHKMDTI